MSLQITLTKHQWQRISELLGNGGLLVLGSTAIPAIVDNFNLGMVTSGLVTASLLIYSSVISAKKY